MRQIMFCLFAIVAVCGNCLDVDGQPIDLIVDQSQSNITFSILGASDTSSLTGTGVIELTPLTEPFSTAQLTGLELTIADGFTINILGGLVSVNAAPNSTMLSMTIPGTAGKVDMNNQFDQLGNTAATSGMVFINDPFGLAGGSMTLDLKDAGPGLFDIIDAQLSATGNVLTVTSEVDVTIEATDTITVNAFGLVVLTGELPAFIPGDVNCDGVVDLLDVEPFIALLSSGQFSEKADINADGAVDLLDVTPFVALLQGS